MTAIPDGAPRWSVGDEIRKARRNAQLEQADLADLLGVARSTISGWENDHSEPSISQWRRIAELTKASWLLTGKGDTIVTYASDLVIVDEGQLRLPIDLPPSKRTPTLAVA